MGRLLEKPRSCPRMEVRWMNPPSHTWVRRLAVLGAFFVAIAIMTMVSVFGRTSVQFTPAIQNALAALGAIIVASAGWVSVSQLTYGLRWTPLIGLLLSVGSHWSLPMFHEAGEIPPLLLINSSIFAAVAFLGGSAAVVYRRSR
jgi:hypothetical protein